MRGLDIKFFEKLFEDIKSNVKDTSAMFETIKEEMSPTLAQVTKGISLEDLVEEDTKEFTLAHESFKEGELEKIHSSITTWVARMVTKLKDQVVINREAISDLFGLINSAGDKVVELMAIVQRLEEEKKELATKLSKVEEELAKDKEELAIKLAKDKEELDAKLEEEKAELATKLAKEKEDLSTKMVKEADLLDEVQQRGLKGNLFVSSTTRKGKQGQKVARIAREYTTIQGRRVVESDLEYVTRLCKLKSTHTINPNHVAACHGVGERREGDWDTFVISFWNRTKDSSWEILTTAMMTGKVGGALAMNHRANVFINHQLTKPRAALAKAARQARLAGQVEKECVTPNGEVKVKEFLGGWKKVTRVSEVEAIRAPARRI